MINHFANEVLKLKSKPHVNQQIIKKFLERINLDSNLTKERNPSSHLCSFFLPINFKKQIIYLGHHIKADDWIPPGGHIKFDETPIQTVEREFYEELKHQLTGEKIEQKRDQLYCIGTIPGNFLPAKSSKAAPPAAET